MKSKGPWEANQEESEIPRVKDPKIYPGKTPNEDYIRVWTRNIWWKLENDSALYDCVSHIHMSFT